MSNKEFDKLVDVMHEIWEKEHWDQFINWLNEICENQNISSAIVITRDMKSLQIEDYDEGEYCRAKNIGFNRIPAIKAFLKGDL